MKNFKSILGASLLTLSISSAAFAGNISGAPIAAGNISGTPTPSGISKNGNISGIAGNISGIAGNISGFQDEAYNALLGLLAVVW